MKPSGKTLHTPISMTLSGVSVGAQDFNTATVNSDMIPVQRLSNTFVVTISKFQAVGTQVSRLFVATVIGQTTVDSNLGASTANHRTQGEARRVPEVNAVPMPRHRPRVRLHPIGSNPAWR